MKILKVVLSERQKYVLDHRKLGKFDLRTQFDLINQ